MRALLLAAALLLPTTAAAQDVVVGSKKFTESVVLGELVAAHLRSEGLEVVHRPELGGTRIVFNALIGGEIDVYVEYTGTLKEELVPDAGPGMEGLRAAVAKHGLKLGDKLGFNNTYALGTKRDDLRSIDDLKGRDDLKLAFSNEFIDRTDGWIAVREGYGLTQTPRGLDHDLAYRGLVAGDLDVMDLYATDAEIGYYGITVLTDDRSAFTPHEAVVLYRADTAAKHPALDGTAELLGGAIDAPTMVGLNARAKIDKVPAAQVAADFLKELTGAEVAVAQESRAERFVRNTKDHLVLVGISLLAAILASIPLGIVAARRPRLGTLILGTVGLIQTIPSLALLVMMIPLLGIGGPPAVVALFLYSLLPIVRNTHAGLTDLPAHVRESAAALGLPAGARLRLVELPMASRTILAGIKTAAVINVGTATLGALIGAGGYGAPILTGIRLDDTALILEGAVPAALLALVVQGLFEAVESRLPQPPR